jgi:hypothetical protein
MIVWVNILALLDESKLDLGASLFEITMQTNHVVVLELQLMCITLSLNYGLQTSNNHLQHYLFKYFVLEKSSIIISIYSL